MAWWSPVLRVLLCSSLVLFVAASVSANKKKPPVNILQMRKSHGPFKSVDHLLAIRGLGEKRLDKMRKYLTVAKPAAAKSVLPGANSTPPQKEPDKP